MPLLLLLLRLVVPLLGLALHLVVLLLCNGLRLVVLLLGLALRLVVLLLCNGLRLVRCVLLCCCLARRRGLALKRHSSSNQAAGRTANASLVPAASTVARAGAAPCSACPPAACLACPRKHASKKALLHALATSRSGRSCCQVRPAPFLRMYSVAFQIPKQVFWMRLQLALEELTKNCSMAGL